MLFGLLSSAERETLGVEDLMIQAHIIADSIRLGGHRKRKAGTGEQFWQFRPYDPHGDTPQNIDWRQSAKSSRLEVRDQEWQMPQTTHIWCDGGHNMQFSSRKSLRTKSQEAQLLSLAIGMLIVRGGDNIAAYGVTAGHSKRTLENFATSLIDTSDSVTSQPLDFGKSHNSNLIMVSDFWEDLNTIENTLSTVANSISRGFLIQVIDPAELDLAPYRGRTLFSNSAQADTTDIPNVTSIREKYSEAIDQHCSALKTLAARYGFTLLTHRTDRSITDSLQTLRGFAEL